MFKDCFELSDIIYVKESDVSNGTSFENMFYNAKNYLILNL